MQDWLKTQLAAGFPALAGSAVSGTLAVKQELVNELLADLLLKSRTGASTPPPSNDLTALAKFVQTASVRAEPGTLLIDFKISV